MILPGDLFSFVSISSNSKKDGTEYCDQDDDGRDLVAVLHYPFWSWKGSGRTPSLLLLSMVQGDDSLNSTAVLSTCSPLLSTPVCISSAKDANEVPINHSCRSSGFLDHGTRYYVYPMVFYCDDFNPYSSMFPRGSVGGCYMQPANFPLREDVKVPFVQYR